MTTVTTTTVTPAAPPTQVAPAITQPRVYAAQQPAYVPPVAYAHAPAPGVLRAPVLVPTVASSYTSGTSLPHHHQSNTSSLHTTPHQLDGYHTVLGDTYRERGEYDLYLNALNASTPILNKARADLNVPVGWDMSKMELAPHQIFKKHHLKEFKREIMRLVDEQRAARPVLQPQVVHTVPAVAPAQSAPAVVPARSIPAASLPQLM